MRATMQKIAWARRAVEAMRAAQASAVGDLSAAELDKCREDFQYHFGAFLAFIGSLRQFVLDPAFKVTMYELDQTDVDFCTCIDLRNTDVHVQNTASEPITRYEAKFTAGVAVSTSDPSTSHHIESLKRALRRFGWPHRNTHNEDVAVSFLVDSKKLPATFGVVKGNRRPIRDDELALLKEKSAVEIAEAAISFFELSVLPAAKAFPIVLP